MMFRLLAPVIAVVLASVVSPSGWATDCVAIQTRPGPTRLDDDISLVERVEAKANCGPLRLFNQRRDDPDPEVSVEAHYVEFEVPRNAAERLHNEWIRGKVELLPLEGPFKEGQFPFMRRTSFVEQLYLSSRLLSAAYSASYCCTSGPRYEFGSLNVDVVTGRVLSLGGLFDLGMVADRCWQQFATEDVIDGRKEQFVVTYPRDAPFVGKDLEIDVRARRTADPGSHAWTVSAFGHVLREPRLWSVSDEGLTIYFGELLGWPYLPFYCRIGIAELAKVVRPGVAVPP